MTLGLTPRVDAKVQGPVVCAGAVGPAVGAVTSTPTTAAPVAAAMRSARRTQSMFPLLSCDRRYESNVTYLPFLIL